jgi:capsular exopolysaccharide synthesis family protein
VDLAEHFRVIWRRKWRVLIASLAVAAAVFVRSTTIHEVFEASTLLSVTSGRAAAGDAVTKDDTVFLASNYAELARTRPVVETAVRRSGLTISVNEAIKRTKAQASTDVGFLSVVATGPTAREAERLAQSLADALVGTVQDRQVTQLAADVAPIERQISDLQSQLQVLPTSSAQRPVLEARYQALVQAETDRQLRPSDRLTIASPARAIPGPVAPTPKRDAVLALLAAFVVNAELVVLLEAMSDRFRPEDQDEVTRVTGLPVLARIPRSASAEVVEEFRSLRTHLMFMQTETRLRTLAIVSVNAGAGKSFVAINLAGSIAGLEMPVVLIDADLRLPSLDERLGVPRAPGLSDILFGTPPADAAHPVAGTPNLSLLPAGSPVPDPAGLLGGRAFRDAVASLTWTDLVIVDTPAIDHFADALAIASQCDATLIVLDTRATSRRAVQSLIERVRQVHGNPLGIVVNKTERSNRPSYYYGRTRSTVVTTTPE